MVRFFSLHSCKVSTSDFPLLSILLFCFSGLLIWISGLIFTVSATVLMCSLGLQLLSFALVVFFILNSIQKLNQNSVIRFLCIVLGFIFLSHAIGIFTPEVGFDALWYHLPITAAVATTHVVRYLPSIYQSGMPSLGEMMFVPLYTVLGVFGVKVFVYFIFVLLIISIYRLSRCFMPSQMAFLLTLGAATFQTISWQASSAYVDSIRTVLELAAFLFISHWKGKEQRFLPLVLAGFLLGSSLSVKMPALFFLPAWIVFLWSKFSLKTALQVFFIAMIVYVPWHIVSYLQVGEVIGFATAFQHGSDLIVRSNPINGIGFFIIQTSKLFVVPIIASFHAEGYLSPLFLFAFPFFLISFPLVWKRYRPEVLFLSISLWVWLLLPPLSVRYGEFSILLLYTLATWSVWKYSHHTHVVRLSLISVLIATIGINMCIRIAVNARDMRYILGKESQNQYLKKYDTGILKGPLEHWYGKINP